MYTHRISELVKAACRAQELFTLDELEAYAEANRRGETKMENGTQKLDQKTVSDNGKDNSPRRFKSALRGDVYELIKGAPNGINLGSIVIALKALGWAIEGGVRKLDHALQGLRKSGLIIYDRKQRVWKLKPSEAVVDETAHYRSEG